MEPSELHFTLLPQPAIIKFFVFMFMCFKHHHCRCFLGLESTRRHTFIRSTARNLNYTFDCPTTFQLHSPSVRSRSIRQDDRNSNRENASRRFVITIHNRGMNRKLNYEMSIVNRQLLWIFSHLVLAFLACSLVFFCFFRARVLSINLYFSISPFSIENGLERLAGSCLFLSSTRASNTKTEVASRENSTALKHIYGDAWFMAICIISNAKRSRSRAHQLILTSRTQRPNRTALVVSFFNKLLLITSLTWSIAFAVWLSERFAIAAAVLFITHDVSCSSNISLIHTPHRGGLFVVSLSRAHVREAFKSVVIAICFRLFFFVATHRWPRSHIHSHMIKLFLLFSGTRRDQNETQIGAKRCVGCCCHRQAWLLIECLIMPTFFCVYCDFFFLFFDNDFVDGNSERVKIGERAKSTRAMTKVVQKKNLWALLMSAHRNVLCNTSDYI